MPTMDSLLFGSSEPGLWLDPSDITTLFQDSVGGTPVTASGQPVGLILDKSLALALSSEKATNGTFAADASWTKGANWTIGGGVATKTGGAANNLSQNISAVQGKFYKVSFDLTRTAGTVGVAIGSTTAQASSINASGTYTYYLTPNGADGTIYFIGDSAFAGTIDNVTVKEISGNHCYQTTTTSRPTYRDVGGLKYLEFDGVDDGLASNSIDFTATDAMSVFAGIRKLSDAGEAVVVELGPNMFIPTNGSFLLEAPSAALENFDFFVRGTSQTEAKKSSGVTSPKTPLLTGLTDISSDSNKLRVDGVLAQETTSDIGTGNFSNNSVYVGKRSTNARMFTGYLYSLIVRGALTSDADVVTVEDYIAPKIGFNTPELGTNVESRVKIAPSIVLINNLDIGQAAYTPQWIPEYYFQFGASANQANKVFSDIRTIGASSSDTIDLSWTTLDALGKKLNLTKIKALLLIADQNNVNDILLGGNTAAPVTSFFGAANDKLRIKPGGMIALIAPDANGYAVVQATADKLDITNGGAGSSVTYTILIMGVSS